MSLVQRLKRLPKERDAKGVDRFFSMDYMGSAEFEYGALPASIKVFRKQANVTSNFSVNRTGFWYIGPAAEKQAAIALVESELGDQNIRLKERTDMKLSIDGQSWAKDIVGWWWLSEDSWPYAERATQPTWAIFLSESDAKNWMLGIGNQRTEKTASSKAPNRTKGR